METDIFCDECKVQKNSIYLICILQQMCTLSHMINKCILAQKRYFSLFILNLSDWSEMVESIYGQEAKSSGTF